MTTKARVASFDALRGAAILLVMAAHWGIGFIGASGVIALANAGVILFFLLSGMLIERNLARGDSAGVFLIRRAARIFPVYWFSILAVAAMYGATWTQVLSNATLTAPLTGATRMQGVYWTLYIEAAFYCLAPFVARRAALSLAMIAAVIGGAVALFAFQGSIGSGAFYYLAFCLCGVLIGRWLRGALPASVALVATIAVVCCAAIVMPTGLLVAIPAALSTLVLVVAVKLDFESKALSFVGLISYSLYLLHIVIYNAIVAFEPSLLAATVISTIASFAICWLTWRLIEAPAIAIGHRIAKRLNRTMIGGAGIACQSIDRDAPSLPLS